MDLAECQTCRAPLLARDGPCPYCGSLPVTAAPAWVPSLAVGAAASESDPGTLGLPDWGNTTQSRPPVAPSMHGIPKRIAGVDMARLNLTPFEGYLLMLVDGATTAEDLVAASGLGAHDALAAFGRLAQLGALVFKDDVPAAPSTTSPGGGTALAQVSLKRISAPGHLTLDVGTLLRRVREARNLGDLATARDQVQTAREVYPQDAEVAKLHDELTAAHHAKGRARDLVQLGVRAERVGSMAMAVTFYERALAEFEPSAVLHHRVAMCMLHAGLPQQQALAHARRALELAPHNVSFTQLNAHLQSWRG